MRDCLVTFVHIIQASYESLLVVFDNALFYFVYHCVNRMSDQQGQNAQ